MNVPITAARTAGTTEKSTAPLLSSRPIRRLKIQGSSQAMKLSKENTAKRYRLLKANCFPRMFAACSKSKNTRNRADHAGSTKPLSFLLYVLHAGTGKLEDHPPTLPQGRLSRQCPKPSR